MSNTIQNQNAAVQKALNELSYFSVKESNEMTWIISKGYGDAADRLIELLTGEKRRVEDEIKELKFQLIKKLAEKAEIEKYLTTAAYNAGLQLGIQANTELRE